MGFRFWLILAFLTLELVTTHAALSPELYWKLTMPNTPMPSAVRDLLHQEPHFPEVSPNPGGAGSNLFQIIYQSAASHDVSSNPGGAGSNLFPIIYQSAASHDDPGRAGSNLFPIIYQSAASHDVSSNPGGAGSNLFPIIYQSAASHDGSSNPGGAGSNLFPIIYQSAASHDGSSNPGGVGSNLFPIIYQSAASHDGSSHDDPNGALFFLEKDLRPGAKFNVHFTKSANAATFLPRQVAESIPFSSNRITEILNKLGKKPGSLEADIMESTIKMCEKPANIGEEWFCANSLESMIDLSTLILGNKVEAICTEVEKRSLRQEYEIAAEVKKMTENKAIVCHKLNYAYAVFYCHSIQNTKAYMVPLEGADGTKVKAVAVCHMDTASWHPKHLAFQVLKVTPGIPICHLLLDDNIAWVPTHNQDPAELE